MNRRSIPAGEAFVSVGLKSRIKQGANVVRRDLDELSRGFAAFGGIATGAAAAILAPLTAATQGFSKMGDEVDKMSLRTGVGTDALSGLGFAAEQTGADIQAVERGFFGLSRSFDRLTRGGAASEEAFARIGLTLKDLEGLSPERQLELVANGLAGMTDESLKGATAQEIFGRAGRQLLPLLSEGADGIRAYRAEAEQLGRVFSEDAADSAAEYVDAMNRVNSVSRAVVMQIGGALAPAITDAANAVAGAASGISTYIKENQNVVQAVAAVAAGVGLAGTSMLVTAGVAKGLSISIGLVSTASGVASSVLGVLSGTMAVVKGVTLASSAAIALATGSTAGLTIGTALLNAAYGVSPAAAGAAVAAWGAVGGVLTALTTGSGIASAAAGLLSLSWVSAAASAAAAWATMLAPIAPFIAGGAAVVVAVTAISGAIGVLLVQSVDFGSVWGKAVSMFKNSIAVVMEVFNTIRAALSAGDFGGAAEALWLGIQIAFWDGIHGAWDAIKFLAAEGIKTFVRFFQTITRKAVSVFMAISEAIANPFKAVDKIKEVISDLSNTSISFDISARADKARSRLSELRSGIQNRETASEVEDKQTERASSIVDALKVQKETNHEKLREIDLLQQAGKLTMEQANAARDEVTGFSGKLSKLEDELAILKGGTDAVAHRRMIEEGLTTAQIQRINNLRKEIDAQKELKKERERKIETRVERVFESAGELQQRGLPAQEIFERTIGQLQSDFKSGRIDRDAFEQGSRQARDDRDDRLKELRDEGKALADSLRTPAEVLKEELSRIDRLESQGAISGETADRARTKAREQNDRDTGVEAIRQEAKQLAEALRTPAEVLKAEKARIRELQQKGGLSDTDAGRALLAAEKEFRGTQKVDLAGPSATFSAFAASIIGGGSGDKQLEATRTSNRILRSIDKQGKVARAG